MDLWTNVQTFARTVTSAFGKADGQRSKCPRCKGSGLLTNSTPWSWKKPPPSNDPCWFCEGVGVMPVIGLDGFMVGRASSVVQTRDIKPQDRSSSVVQTRDIKPQDRSSINAQLYLGKFPGSRCKLSTYKPSEEPTDLFHNFWDVPNWLNGLEHEKQQAVTSGSARVSCSSTTKTGDGNSFKSPKVGIKSQTVGTLQPLSIKSRSGGSPQSAKEKSWFKNSGDCIPKFSRQLASSKTTPTKLGHKLFFVQGEKLQQGSPRMIKDYQSPGAISQLHSSIIPSPRRLPLVDNARQQFQAQKIAYISSRPLPLLKSPKSLRSPRKERNRIREQVKKEAVERANRTQSPSISTLAHPSTAASTHKSGNVLHIGSQNWVDASSSWFGLHGDRLLPWLKSPKSLSVGSSSHPNWVNQMMQGSMKDCNPPLLKSTR